jgi:hypothetical protein
MMSILEIIGWVLIGLGLFGWLFAKTRKPPEGGGPKYTKGGQ